MKSCFKTLERLALTLRQSPGVVVRVERFGLAANKDHGGPRCGARGGADEGALDGPAHAGGRVWRVRL